MEKSVPVPTRLRLCGVPAALSVTVTEAVRLPAAAGVKVTLIVQLAFASSVALLAGQVFLCVKSPLFVPPIPMLEMVSGALPLFVSVTTCAEVLVVVVTSWLPTLKLFAPKLTAGPTPTPLNITLCGLFAALSVMVTDPVLVRGNVGAKVTLMVQLKLAAREVPHVSVSAKSPLVAIAMFNSVFCSFVKVNVCAALLLPTA
jgi:hypothetical protein